MVKNKSITVNDTRISVTSFKDEDYICLSDITKGHENGNALIENWLRNKNTIEFLGVWEQLNNPDFNSLEFEGIKESAGVNRFHISVKRWAEATNAKGVISKTGRYGGTYAHKDIAFEFASWINPVFKLYIIKEYQRLKEIESNEYNLEWDVNRVISKINYHIHTDAIKNYIIPDSSFPESKQWIEYANEADLLNVSVFGYTAKEWKIANPKAVLKKENLRDTASINELVVLSNIESFNSEMIKSGIAKDTRFNKLRQMAKDQLHALNEVQEIKSLKKVNDTTYIEAESNQKLINQSGASNKDKVMSDFNKSLKKTIDYNPKDN